MDYCGKMAIILHMAFLKYIFFNANIFIFIEISLRFVAKGSFDNDNESAWVQRMAWHRTGDKPLSEPIVVWFSDIYLCCLAYVSQPKMYLLLREYLDGWQRQSTALTHMHLRREAHPAWYMDTDPCIIPTDPCWMPLGGILCGPLLRPPGVWPAVARGYL